MPAERVEDAGDAHVEAVTGGSHRHGLGEALRLVVHAADPDGFTWPQ